MMDDGTRRYYGLPSEEEMLRAFPNSKEYGSQPLRPLKDWQDEVDDVLSEYELEEVK